MLKTRVLTIIALLAVLVPAGIWLPDTGWLILVAVIAALAAWEWAGLMGIKKGRVVYGVGMLALMLAGVGVLLGKELAWGVFYTLLGLSCLFWIVVVPLCLRFRWKISGFPGLLLGGVILLSFCCELIALYKVRDRWTLLGILLTAWIADIFAYFSGRAFGRHKLAPSISPGKTWEGAIGAVVGVALYWVICFSGRLDWKETLLLVGIAVLATVMCILGDLFESLIKRQAGVKDSSNLLPGHGGILDRIDSWLPLFAFFTMVVVWVGWFD